ncbi:hypothetical protein DOM01_02150, partial [Salmonella enterica subsp. enterica serovar Derby]
MNVLHAIVPGRGVDGGVHLQIQGGIAPLRPLLGVGIGETTPMIPNMVEQGVLHGTGDDGDIGLGHEGPIHVEIVRQVGGHDEGELLVVDGRHRHRHDREMVTVTAPPRLDEIEIVSASLE